MNRENILSKITEFLCDILDMEESEIREDSVFLEDLEMSSVEVFMLAVRIQKCFGATLTESMLKEIETVKDLVDCVAGLTR